MPAQHHSPRTAPPKQNDAKNVSKSTIVPGQAEHKAPLTPGATTALDYKQVQKDELEVLQSVFMDDYEHVERHGAWNTSDHAFKLRLQASSDDEYSCVLSVLMTATYPRTVPEMTLAASSHIRTYQLESLQDIMKETACRLIGQEMIYEIAVAIQDALEDIVQNRLVDQDKPSLDQERALKAISEQKRVEQEEEEVRHKLELKAREDQKQLEREIEDELRRQKEHAKETHERRRRSSLLAEDDNDTVDTDDCILFDRTIKLTLPDGGGAVNFRKVCGMVKIAQGPTMAVYTVRPAFPVHGSRNVALALKQLEFPDSLTDRVEGKRQIQVLEQEIDSLRNIRHSNIATVYESKVTRTHTTSMSHDGASSIGGWRVSVLMELADKGSLQDLLETVDCVPVNTARSWMIGLLEALDHIHRNGAVHSGIHAGNILLFRHGEGSYTTPKFADIGYTKSIRQIIHCQHSISTELGSTTSALWFPPEMSPPNTTLSPKTTRKTDIWNLGVVFLQMIFGLNMVERYDSPQKLMDSMNLSESLSDFIESIFKVDPKKRPTAFELLPSEFLRNDDPITHPESPPSPMSTSRLSWPPANHRNNNNSRHQNRARHNSVVGPSSLSRYANDFVELGRLGKGGYGEVVKARNRLDGREYAIKQITQTSGAKLTEILSEVVLLSRLNHRYVVRYFTAWLEDHDSVHGASMEETDEEEDSAAISFTESTTSVTRSRSGATDGRHVKAESEQSDDLQGIHFGESTAGLDFISNSNSYPNIEFGFSSDESGDEESSEGNGSATESEESVKQNNLRRTTSNERRRGKVTLYIQMSLAERLTLRDCIRQGIDLEESWKLFRQILEGLAHIHSLGIIHRDLKPENVFIDLSGDPQIGDFGLATNDLVVNNEMSKATTGSSSGDNELTTNVGTALYVAPELRKLSQGNYNEKVDMYSLGIIFFEMVYPLGSGMERALVLTELRDPEIVFPPEFWTERRAVQGSIIKALLNHNATERPSSSELLNSGKLPFMIEDKTIRHVLESLSDPNTPYHSQVMQALFSPNSREYKDHTYDTGWKGKELDAPALLLQGMVKERLTEIFRNHGAVETSRPVLMPRSKFYPRDVAQLVDQNGTLVQLPYDLTLPNARFLARSVAPAPKTFTFGTVYRENSAGGQPTSSGEVDFDIISSDSLDLSLSEAEVLKVIDEVIDAFPSLRNMRMCYHVNHSNLLDAIMEFCRIKAPARGPAKEILSKLNHRQWNWAKLRNELATAKLGILPTSLDDLARFDWRDEPEKAFERLHTILEGTSSLDKVQPLFAHIRAVIVYLRQFGVHRKVYVNPLGTWNDKFYRGGLVFQCIYDTTKRDVFAAGGRYDFLIREHRPKMHGHIEETHAVGCNMGWEQLFKSMDNYNKNQMKGTISKHLGTDEECHGAEPWTPRRCDVTVSAFDSTALRSQAISLLQELWTCGIRAELGQISSGQTNRIPRYKQDGASWLVTIKPGSVTGERTLKIKSLLSSRQDVELKGSELIPWIKSELVERDRKDMIAEQRTAPGRLHRYTSSDVTPRAVSDLQSGADVRILAADRKGRKINRNTIIDLAQSTAANLSAMYLKCPVVTVDVRADILDEIKFMGLNDTEGWKRLVQNVPAPERKYVLSIQELLEEIKTEGHKECWVFSFRTWGGGIIHLQA